MLALLLAILLGGAIEASACEPEFVPMAVVDAAAMQPSDHQDDGSQRETHAACSHGHCHHGNQLLRSGSADAASMVLSAGPHFIRVPVGMRQSAPDVVKEPPRI